MTDQPPGLPRSLLTAVRLMYAGAVLQIAVGVTVFVVVGRLRDNDDVYREYADYAARHGGDAQSLIDEAVTNWRIGAAVATVLLTALWIFMARANRRGKRWARTTSTVLAAFALIGAVYTLIGGVDVIAILVVLLAGAIVYLLYRPEATAYYAAVADGTGGDGRTGEDTPVQP